MRDIVDVNGKVLNHIDYNAFGQVVKQTGKSECAFGYTGKLFDNATGLQYNINRWYDANVGKWISEDPIRFLGKDANLYRYVKNGGTLFRDLYGLLSEKNAKDVLDCWAPRSNGSGDCGFSEGRVRKLVYDATVIESANSLAIDLMFIGLGLPESIAGAITVSTVQNVIEALLEQQANGTDISGQDVVENVISEVLGNIAENCTPDELAPLVSLIQDMLKSGYDNFSTDDCISIAINYGSSNDPLKDPSVQEEVTCAFMVCAKKKWFRPIREWKFSGTCSYQCSDSKVPGGSKCCTHDLPTKATNVFFSASGYGVGSMCTID